MQCRIIIELYTYINQPKIWPTKGQTWLKCINKQHTAFYHLNDLWNPCIFFKCTNPNNLDRLVWVNIYTHTYIHMCGLKVYSLRCTKVDWKVHRLLSLNVTKWGLFFNIIHLAVHTLLPSVLQCLHPIGPKSHLQQI